MQVFKIRQGQKLFKQPDFYSVFFTISFRRMAGRTFFKLPDTTELTFLAGQAPSCISASCVFALAGCTDWPKSIACKHDVHEILR